MWAERYLGGKIVNCGQQKICHRPTPTQLPSDKRSEALLQMDGNATNRDLAFNARTEYNGEPPRRDIAGFCSGDKFFVSTTGGVYDAP